MNITGALQAAAKYITNAGQYAMGIIGSLGTAKTPGGGGGVVKRIQNRF